MEFAARIASTIARRAMGGTEMAVAGSRTENVEGQELVVQPLVIRMPDDWWR